jgi:hypothetical protein
MIGISSQPFLDKNLNILHTFGEYPAKLENIKDFKSSLEVFGETYSHHEHFLSICKKLCCTDVSTESEAGNLNDVFAMFCLSSFMRR